MFNQDDLNSIKEWIISNVLKEVAYNTVKGCQAKDRDIMDTQVSNNKYSSFTNIQGYERGSVHFRVDRGQITGTQVVPVGPSTRQSSKTGKVYTVRAHDKNYVNKRLFRLPNGKFMVQDYMPREVVIDLVTNTFYESLVDRAEYFQGTNQKL